MIRLFGWLKEKLPAGRCPECGERLPHTEIKVRSDGYGISVVCHRGAMELNQQAIRDLLATFPSRPKLG